MFTYHAKAIFDIGFSVGLVVPRFVEIAEEEKEQEAVHSDPVDKYARILTGRPE